MILLTKNSVNNKGFTLVELLIVIVVIAILAAISVVAYNGVQERARDTVREADIAAITKAMELYYVKNGRYPLVGGSTTINGGWVTTADASWQNFLNEMTAVEPNLPGYPSPTPGKPGMNTGGYSYDLYINRSTYCGSASGQMYILVYRFEKKDRKLDYIGNCTTNPLGPYPPSNYRVAR